jgi:ribonuclease VapC
VVLDTSALLAVLFDEPHADWVVERMDEHASDLTMSTVNLTETLIHLRDRLPDRWGVIEERLLESGIRFVPPDTAQARIAAEARMRFPLNLGDCFAYALAVAEDCPILALDGDFRRTGWRVVSPDRAATDT